MSFSSAAIELRDLCVRFPGSRAPAVDAFSGDIPKGRTIALTGPSGCGKSTLLRTVAGFIPEMIEAEVSGHVRLAERVVADADVAELATTVGLVQQDPDAQICTLSVRSEIAFGPENLCLPVSEVRQRTQEAAEAMGIAHLLDRDTTTLSGGEKQRLAVASILAMRPSVILLDEPTAHLDPDGACHLFTRLDQLQRAASCTLLIAEHRLTPLEALNPELWIMAAGRRVERDPVRTHTSLARLVKRDRDAAFMGPLESASIKVMELGYGYTEPLFQHLSFELGRGQVLGIIGPNGGGKTTLLRLLAGLERPHAGSIACPEGTTLGMVFQHPHQQIFERTVRRDLEIEGTLPDDRLCDVLTQARLDGMADRAPHSLSLGEQRRLTVLGALRNEPRLLLLDEPFIGQDRDNVEWIASQIERARRRGAMTCLVTHDIPMAGALCDRVLYLGEETVEGTPGEVFDRLRAAGRIAYTPEFWDVKP